MKKLHMTWRYNAVTTFCGEDESGVAKFYYGENLVNYPVATESGKAQFIQLEIENVQKAEELLAFIKAVSTQQWNDGYRDAINEMQAFLKEEKH